MSRYDDPMVLRQIIMDHYQSPTNKGLKEEKGYEEHHASSSTCIDDIKVQVKIENDKISDINFDGIACTISTASTDIAASLLEGRTVDEARALIEVYKMMVKNGEIEKIENLGELVAFKTVSKQANRISCALIGIEAIENAINKGV